MIDTKRADEGTYRWTNDQRILSLTPAPPGWFALFRKSEYDGYNPHGDSIHDFAWVEPIACFALIETIEREEIRRTDEDGDLTWDYTGRTELDAISAGGPEINGNAWPHTTVRAVWRDSEDGSFPGVDEIIDRSHGAPDFILAPGEDPNASWILNRFRGEEP